MNFEQFVLYGIVEKLKRHGVGIYGYSVGFCWAQDLLSRQCQGKTFLWCFKLKFLGLKPNNKTLTLAIGRWAIPQGINESANFRFLQRLSIIFGFSRDCRWSASCGDYRPRKMASCRVCPCDSASCQDSRQEAKLHGQSLQETIYHAQQSRQEARDHGQSRLKPNMTDSLCWKRKLADLSIPCEFTVG